MRSPRTLEEARNKRYGEWSGNPKGSPYQEGQCAYEVQGQGRGIFFYQCNRKAHTGPGNLYCKTHAKKVEGNLL